MVYLPLWKIWKSVGIIIPNIWKNKIHVPNHQPVYIYIYIYIPIRIQTLFEKLQITLQIPRYFPTTHYTDNTLLKLWNPLKSPIKLVNSVLPSIKTLLKCPVFAPHMAGGGTWLKLAPWRAPLAPRVMVDESNSNGIWTMNIWLGKL